MSACVIFGFFAVDVSKSVKTGLKSTGAVNVCLLAGASLKGKVPPPPTQPASLIAGLTEVGECPGGCQAILVKSKSCGDSQVVFQCSGRARPLERL